LGGKTYKVDEAFAIADFGWFHWKLLFICGTLYAIGAIEVTLHTLLMPIFEDLCDIQSPWDSIIEVSFLIGGLFGALTLSKLSDVYGRSKVITTSTTILSAAGTATAFVTNPYSLLICRFFSGAGLAGVVTSLTLLLEFVPRYFRGMMIVFWQQFWSYGSIFSTVLAWIIIPNTDEYVGWKYYVALSTIPMWSVTICSYYIPESIRWHCTSGEFAEAEKWVQQILLTNGKKAIEGRLVQTEKVTMRGKLKDLFVPKYRRTTILMIINFMISLACYYAITFVSRQLFINASLYACEFVTACTELLALGFAWVIDRYSRKNILLSTSIINIIGFSLIAIFWHYDLVGCNMFVVVFGVRVSSLVNNAGCMLYFTEYYPTAIRSTALGTAYAMSRFSVAAFAFISEDVNLVAGSLLFCAFSMISFLCTLLFPEDTTGKILGNSVDRTDCRTPGPHSELAVTKGMNIEKYVTLNV